ncbi:hypothetical protein KAMAJI_00290 [Serratia phage vB_SmaM-Kamaji]|nr:hypothetical protein KAMAJI_00290 [Serratia phage vB_SmaM-Kamaji]
MHIMVTLPAYKPYKTAPEVPDQSVMVPINDYTEVRRDTSTGFAIITCNRIGYTWSTKTPFEQVCRDITELQKL